MYNLVFNIVAAQLMLQADPLHILMSFVVFFFFTMESESEKFPKWFLFERKKIIKRRVKIEILFSFSKV